MSNKKSAVALSLTIDHKYLNSFIAGRDASTKNIVLGGSDGPQKFMYLYTYISYWIC